MSDGFTGFDSRIRRIEGQRQKMAQGYELKMRDDGLIVSRPRRSGGSWVKPRVVLLFLAGVFAFKGLLIATLGITGYDARVQGLSDGSMVEQAGAVVMQSDPVSRGLGAFLAPRLAKLEDVLPGR